MRTRGTWEGVQKAPLAETYTANRQSEEYPPLDEIRKVLVGEYGVTEVDAGRMIADDLYDLWDKMKDPTGDKERLE